MGSNGEGNEGHEGYGCHEGYEGHEESKGSKVHFKNRDDRSFGKKVWSGEESGYRCRLQSRCARHCRGEEDREVYHSWALDAQNADQACQEGRHSHGLWQEDQSQGSKGQEDCQGVLCLCSEEEHQIARVLLREST